MGEHGGKIVEMGRTFVLVFGFILICETKSFESNTGTGEEQFGDIITHPNLALFQRDTVREADIDFISEHEARVKKERKEAAREKRTVLVVAPACIIGVIALALIGFCLLVSRYQRTHEGDSTSSDDGMTNTISCVTDYDRTPRQDSYRSDKVNLAYLPDELQKRRVPPARTLTQHNSCSEFNVKAKPGLFKTYSVPLGTAPGDKTV